MSEDMAEQDTDHHYTEDKEAETPSTNMDHVCVSPSEKQEETDPDVKQQLSENSASSSASTNTESNHDNGEDMEKHDSKICDPAEERIVPEKLNTTSTTTTTSTTSTTTTTTGSSRPDKDATLNVKKNSNQLQPDEGSHGDSTGETAKESSGDTGEKEAPGTPTQPPPCDRKNEQGDRPEPKTQDSDNTDTEAGEGESNLPDISGPAEPQLIRIQGDTGEEKAPGTLTPPPQEHQVDGPTEESPDRNDTDPTDGEDDGSGPEEDKGLQENTTSPQTETVVETIGSITTQETDDAEPAVIGNQGGIGIYVIAGILALVFAILVSHFQPESPPQKDDVRQIDIFLRQLEKVKTQFPNQRAELWQRSKIHLLRHLQTAQPTEPVSLILTAGHRAERTLHCLAQSLASSFSSALNASVLHIDGASKASQDSDQVKLDIDSKLQGAFEGDKPVAVINRFEELPPGSTLIFYRYCDHENAAYKKTCLIFTVLLGEEEEIPAETRLSTVEEMVDDHLQKKFLSDGHPVSFDRMDLDKYGGLWSRISHLILPVAAEERIEREGC